MNGQAKIDFLKQSKYIESIFNELPKIYQNALIIEWFDSVGIYISINYVSVHTDLRSGKGFQSLVCYGNLSTMFRGVDTRQQATEKALEKAIILYNEKFKENE